MDDQRFQEIEQLLIEAITSFNTVDFIPTLLSHDILVEFSNKLSFYIFFKGILMAAKDRTIGKLHVKIERSFSDSFCDCYNFYDEVHLHPRFSIDVKRTVNNVILLMYPF